MASSNKVEVEVRANVAGTESVDRLGQSLGATSTAAGTLGAKAQGATGGVNAATGATKELSESSRQARTGLDSASTGLDNAKSSLLALAGVGAGALGLKNVTELADSYKNLEARIKLVTGEGAAFDSAFEGVFAIAKRTNSAVEETGLLFSKLAEAGKTLGVSQAEALGLTETINQSIQLSGASAEASKAAIIQLVQGLQSGVLRGDEFNSIMEQSPRLAKALANGLDVTTGELRKMAEAGKLTSETVIKALQGQADVIKNEFGQLPVTVGRAMTNLQTSFMAFAGETDKAGGYTAKLAGAVDALAKNLDTVAAVAIHAGQVMLAMKLASMAREWLTAGAAMSAAAAATETSTAATVRNSAAKTGNTTATTANTTAQTANAAAHGGVATALTASSTAATGASGAFAMARTAAAGLMRAIAPLAALDIALNFKQYGTAIGEWAARMMGAKDRTEELEAAEKKAAQTAQENADARKRQAQATKDAADASFGLSKQAVELVGKFDELRAKGDSAAEAIKKIGKDFDLANIPGIRDAAGVLDKLAADGKISAEQFASAWADALKGQDLAVFEVQARAAFAGTAREAERLAQMLDATLRESIKRTGLDFDVISGGMGKAAKSALNDTQTMIDGLDRLKAMGVDTAQALTASLGKGIQTADSQKAIEAVRLQIEQVRKVLGDKVADGLLDQAKQKALELTDALNKAKPGIDSLREAMTELGLKSRESLQATASKAQEAYATIVKAGQEEGESYLAWQARKQAAAKAMLERMIAANGGLIDESIRARAAMEGIDLAADKAGKTVTKAMEGGALATGKLTGAARESVAEIQRLGAELDAINAKYGRPDGKGSILTKDDMKAVDNGGLSTLEQKRAAGTLTKDDLAAAQGVFKAAQTNLDVMQKNWSVFGLDGIKSVQEDYNKSRQMLEQVQNTVNVRISTPDGRIQNVPTTQDGSQALIAALKSAKLSAGI